MDATSSTFAKGILGAFIYSADGCCPGATATAPIQCGGQCAGSAYGASAIIDTAATLEAGLVVPAVVTLDANWMNDLTCAEDREWTGSPDDSTTSCLLYTSPSPRDRG